MIRPRHDTLSGRLLREIVDLTGEWTAASIDITAGWPKEST